MLLTPRFNINDITPNQFEKMKVNKAKNIFSHDVSCSFKYISSELDKSEYICAAWFVAVISKWFSLMTSRYYKIALGKNNTTLYEENIAFLKEVIHIFNHLHIGNGTFKPVQRGVMLSTQSILDLTEYLLSERNFKYVLTSRFTQDCVENLFSQIRSKNVIPDALQFMRDIKVISIAMYMREIKTGNYEDDRMYLTGFLDYLNITKKKG